MGRVGVTCSGVGLKNERYINTAIIITAVITGGDSESHRQGVIWLRQAETEGRGWARPRAARLLELSPRQRERLRAHAATPSHLGETVQQATPVPVCVLFELWAHSEVRANNHLHGDLPAFQKTICLGLRNVPADPRKPLPPSLAFLPLPKPDVAFLPPERVIPEVNPWGMLAEGPCGPRGGTGGHSGPP